MTQAPGRSAANINASTAAEVTESTRSGSMTVAMSSMAFVISYALSRGAIPGPPSRDKVGAAPVDFMASAPCLCGQHRHQRLTRQRRRPGARSERQPAARDEPCLGGDPRDRVQDDGKRQGTRPDAI